MDLTLHRLVEFAIRAPSGENAQPWRFMSKRKDELEVYVESNRDHSPYSWGHRSAYVAIGAAIENMKIGASSLGKKIDVTFFPEAGNDEFVARIKVMAAESADLDPLLDAILKRVTNRKPYSKYSLSENEIKRLTDAPQEPCPPLLLTTDTRKMERIALASCTNERIMLGNERLHQYFFSHVNWTEAEDLEKKEGFFIKSLELPPPAVLGFKAASAWSRASVMNRYLHFNEVVQKQNAKLYAGSSAMGAIATTGDSPKEAVLAGMSMERVWLTATSLELAFQPMAGIMYLKLGVDHTHSQDFSEEETKTITEAYKELQRLFELSEKQIYFIFRIGKAEAPSAIAQRYTVEEVLHAEA